MARPGLAIARGHRQVSRLQSLTPGRRAPSVMSTLLRGDQMIAAWNLRGLDEVGPGLAEVLMEAIEGAGSIAPELDGRDQRVP